MLGELGLQVLSCHVRNLEVGDVPFILGEPWGSVLVETGKGGYGVGGQLFFFFFRFFLD